MKEYYWIYFAQYLSTGKVILFGTSWGLINKEMWDFYCGPYSFEDFLITAVEQPI